MHAVNIVAAMLKEAAGGWKAFVSLQSAGCSLQSVYYYGMFPLSIKRWRLTN